MDISGNVTFTCSADRLIEQVANPPAPAPTQAPSLTHNPSRGAHIPRNPQPSPRLQEAQPQGQQQTVLQISVQLQITQPTASQGLAVVQNQPVVVPTVQKITDTSIQRISSELNSKKNNWGSWSTSMHNMFKMNNCVKYIDGTIQCPNPKIDSSGVKNWHWNNNYTKFLIDNNMPEEEKLIT